MEKPPSIEKKPATDNKDETDSSYVNSAEGKFKEKSAESPTQEELSRDELERRFKFAKDTGRMMEASMYEQELKNKEAKQPSRFERKLDSWDKWNKRVKAKTEELRKQRKQRKQDWGRSTRNPNLRDLGLEREADVEKAWYMATIENLFQSQADAYNDYLESPDAHLVEKRVEFSMLKELHISPEDLKREGERQAEIAGQLYDKDKKITEYAEKKSKLGLLKEAIIGGVQAGAYMIKASYYDLPRIALKAWNKKDWRLLLTADRDFKNTLDKACVGGYRMWVATESLFKLNKKEKRSMNLETVLELEKVQERTGEYEIPKFTIHEQPAPESFESPKSETETETGAGAGAGAETKTKTKTKATTETGPIHTEVSEKLFEWLEAEYRNYLKTNRAPLGFSDVFKSFKSKDVKPEDIKAESKQMSNWLDSLSEWQTRVDLLKNKEKVQDEQVLNFFDFFLRLMSTEEKPAKTDKARSIITPIIKVFLASKKLKEFSDQAVAA